jgi:predicted metal-binding membrane protein
VAGGSPIERLVRRERLVVGAALLTVALLAWGYVLSGAGMDGAQDPRATEAMPGMEMAGMDMSRMGMADAPSGGWDRRMWLFSVGMWMAMMIAMMTPAAAPAILLYGRVQARSQALGAADPGRIAPTGVFAGAYLVLWLAVGVLAAGLHWALEASGLLSPADMGSQSRWLSAAVLIGAGLYQLTPLKQACLTRCRSPTQFIVRHWRPGKTGAIRLGLLHGAYCIGCCWLLMGLLFVGGVMNLVWIAALTLLVAAEKLLPWGTGIAKATGIGLVAWGLATVLT